MSLLSSFLIIQILFSTIILSSPLVSSYKCNKDDKKVLSALKEELFLGRWQIDQVPCCDLDGIWCDIQTGRVIGMDLSQMSINFTIPPIVADLPFLRNIRFHKNPGLTGPIPSFLANIKTLAFIDFSWNSFTGPIPEFFAQLTLLTVLDLSFNQLTGTIPPSLGLLSAINSFDFSRNHLTGIIPETFGAKKMYYLALSHNNLTGAIPKSFAGKQFVTLDLSRNQLSGDATHVFGANKELEVLNLSRNQLEFNMSEVVLPETMFNMDLDHNKLYGTLPPEMAFLKWQQLNVSYNRLCGRIPIGNWSLRFDESTFFHNRCLCGAPLPACK